MYSLDINFVKNGEGQGPREYLTSTQILHGVNKFKYKNFSNTVCKSFSTRPLKKIVVDLAVSLFQDHKQGKLTEEKFNKFTQLAVSKISDQGFVIYQGDTKSEFEYNQLINNTLQQGLRDVFNSILKTGRNDEFVQLIKNVAKWSGHAKPQLSSMSEGYQAESGSSHSTSSMGLPLDPPKDSITQATLKLYTQQWLTNQSFSTPAPTFALVDVNSSLSSPEVSSGTIQDKVKLALDLNPRGQILLSINNNQELKEFIELTRKTDLLTDKRISIDLNLVLNEDSATLLHSINVNTKDLIFRTDIQQAVQLAGILKKRKEGTIDVLIETLANANPHMQFTRNHQSFHSNDQSFGFTESLPTPLLFEDDENMGIKLELRAKPFYNVRVESLENDFTDKSISEILLIKKNGNTNQFEHLDKVLKEKHLEKADFITANYNELVKSLSSCITTVNDEASRQKIAALFIKSNVLALSGIESHSFEKLSDDEFADYVLNEHLLKSSLDEIIEKKSSSLSVSVDAYLPNTNSSEQFSQALRERFSRVSKTDDATYLMLDFKLNSNQNFISSIVGKFNDRDQAKSFVNEYFEQRFQLSGINLEKPDSKFIFKEFLEKTQGNYGITEQNLLEVIQSCEAYFVKNNFPAIPAVIQDYLTPKGILIERVLRQSFQESSFNDYSNEQKALYIDLQQQSQKLSDSDFSSYITTNLFKKYLENKVKLEDNSLEFGMFAFQTFTIIASIDSSLEQALVFHREPDLTKISTNPSCLLRGEVWKNSPETLIANMLRPLDRGFIHNLPGYSQITDQVKSVFIDTLLWDSSFDVASDIFAKLLRGSIPYDPSSSDKVRLMNLNGSGATFVTSIPPRASNDELLGQIMQQCARHLSDFVERTNLSQDTSQAAFYDSFFGKFLDIFTGIDENAKQELRKKIISLELERNFPDKLFSDSPRSHEILNERAIQKQFLFAKLEPSEASSEILTDIYRLYEFITDMDSKNSPYQRFNGLVLDEASVQSNLRFYEKLKRTAEPAVMKQALFDEINSEPRNWLDPARENTNFNKLFQGLNSELRNQSEATKLGINFDKYKEFRIDILLMQRQESSPDDVKEFVKLNLASVFETLPENKAETVAAIGKLIKNIDSNLTSDMQDHSLSHLNLEPSIKAALDTPANKIKNQMQTALENIFTSSNKANIKLPETIKNTNAPEIQFYLDTQKLITEMRLANPASAGTAKDISNAIFGKLATYINEAAKEAKLEGFNLLALRDHEKEFVTDLLNKLGVSNKALDTYFTDHKAEVFEASVQSVFQPSSDVSILTAVNDMTDVQALIDNAVINLLVAPDENTLRQKAFGTDAINRADELRIPRNKDIRQAYVEASRELINSRRDNPRNDIAIVKAIVSDAGVFTKNIKAENSSGVLKESEAQALFYGQYKAFADLFDQGIKLQVTKPEFDFLQSTFLSGDEEGHLAFISEALQRKESFTTEHFIQYYLLADQGANSSSNGINENILAAGKLNIGEKENIDSLALISLVLKGSLDRQTVAQELKEYLETKDSFLTNTVDGGKIPYIDTASTHTKLQAGIDLGEELSGAYSAEDGLVGNAVAEGIQAVIDSIKTANGKDPTVKLISDAYPREALADIITKSIFGEAQNLDASVYQLYKDSGYNPEVLKQTETILVDLNKLAKAGADFKLCPDFQAKCAELNTSWEAASPVDLNDNLNLRLDFAITEEVKLNDDNLALVKAYVNLRKGFSTVTGGSDAEKTSRDSKNLTLIKEFKETYNKQNPDAEYDAQNPAYLTTLEVLNNKYSSIVEAHQMPPDGRFVASITNFIKESDDLLISVSTSAKGKLIEKFKSAEIAKPQSATNEQMANTYMHFYNQMQNHYRQNPAFFEKYVDQSVNAVLEKSDVTAADDILRKFFKIIQVLDGIFEGILVGSPKANFTPLSDTYAEIRQKQNAKLY